MVYILELKTKLEISITTTFGKRSNNALLLVKFLFTKPIVHVNQVREVTRSRGLLGDDIMWNFYLHAKKRQNVLLQTIFSRNVYICFGYDSADC